MAPRKKVEEKPSANDAADMVLQYLRKSSPPFPATPNKLLPLLPFPFSFSFSFSLCYANRVAGKQNRPYSALDVSANLHNRVTKPAAAKILKDLHEQKQIEGRAAGKQIVYHALQNAEDSYTPEQLAALDMQIAGLRTETSTLMATAKTLRSTLSALNATLSTADLVSSVHALEAEKVAILVRLESLRAGKVKRVSQREREEGERERKRCVAVATKREKIAREMWKMIEEAVPEKEMREELRERFDLDG